MPHTIPQIKIITKKEMQLVYKDIIATPHPVSDGNKESLRIYTQGDTNYWTSKKRSKQHRLEEWCQEL